MAERKAGSVRSRFNELWFRWHLHPWGLVGAVAMFVLGLTPSLLPRDSFYQAIVSGVGAGIGYALGLLCWVIWHDLVRPRLHGAVVRRASEIPERWRIRIEVVLLVAGLVVAFGFVLASLRWQRATAVLTGAQPYSLVQYLPVLPLGILFFMLTVALGRFLMWLAERIARALPDRVRTVWRGIGAWAVVLLLVLTVVEHVIPGTIVRAGEAMFSDRDRYPEDGIEQPLEPERSGSPDSLVSWDGLGTHGNRFVAGGLHAEQLEELTGRESREPIRVYAGLRNAESIGERAQLMIAELERTHAQDRDAILLTMSTGSGWVDHWAAQAFELLHDGDTAVVSAQYSYLPSVLHFLSGGDTVREAGQELITPVVDWWNALPEESRPKLYLYGESLGSTAVESAFSGLRDIANSVDGILLAGPPNFNPLWKSFVTRRDPGTREVSPEFAGGTVVRFAQTAAQVREEAADARAGGAPWGPTRMLYIQRASDPVVWWSEDLILREPDWLKEAPGVDRFSGFHWIPFITFLQVAADLPVSKNVPQGHGHNYGDALVDGFAAIDSDSSLTDEDIDLLNEQLEQAVEMSGEARFG